MSHFASTESDEDPAGAAHAHSTTRDVSPNVSPDVLRDVPPRDGVGDPAREPGSYFVRITDPSQPRDRAVTRVPGTLWDLGIPIVSGKRLTVVVRIPAGKDPADCGVAFVRATYTTADGLAVQNVQVPAPNGRARFDGIPARRATVEAVDDAENRLAVLFADLSSDDNAVELDLTTPALTLRIVDGAGVPVPNARVRIVAGGSGDVQQLDEASDGRGLIALPGLVSEALSVHASHPDVGTRTSMTIEPRGADDGPVEIRLDAPATLRVRFCDHSQALDGVRARILDARTDFEVAAPISDSEGRVCCERVAAGRYRLSVVDPDYWPVEQGVDAALGAEFTEVQVRRRGDLDLTVRSPSGRPMANVAIDLHSVEFDADVATWVDDGRNLAVETVVSDSESEDRPYSSGLATDRAGRLFLGGLPNGSYRWRATSSGGASTEGFVTIPPRGRAEVSATVG